MEPLLYFLNILAQMIRDLNEAKEKDQEGIILSKDKVAVTSKYTLEEFA